MLVMSALERNRLPAAMAIHGAFEFDRFIARGPQGLSQLLWQSRDSQVAFLYFGGFRQG